MNLSLNLLEQSKLHAAIADVLGVTNDPATREECVRGTFAYVSAHCVLDEQAKLFSGAQQFHNEAPEWDFGEVVFHTYAFEKVLRDFYAIRYPHLQDKTHVLQRYACNTIGLMGFREIVGSGYSDCYETSKLGQCTYYNKAQTAELFAEYLADLAEEAAA